jgi:hypothetical protein
MADAVSLQELIAALSGAVTEAQDAIQQHQLAAIARYFDGSGRPFSFALMLPNPTNNPDADPHRKVVVPLISILEPNLLAISEFTAEFQVELGSCKGVAPEPFDGGSTPVATAPVAPVRMGAPIDVPRPHAPPPPPPQPGFAGMPQAEAATVAEEPAPDVSVALQSLGPAPRMTVGFAAPAQPNGPTARLTIKVVSRPVSEGMTRLITALNQTI